jgi:hypothetical protein
LYFAFIANKKSLSMTCGLIARTAFALAVLATWSQPASAETFRTFSGNCRLQANLKVNLKANLSTPNDRACMAAIAMNVSAHGGGFCIRPTAARPVLDIALSRIRSASRQICPRASSIVAAQHVQQVLQ